MTSRVPGFSRFAGVYLVLLGFYGCAFQSVGLFSVGIGFQQVLTGFNRVSRDDPVAAWMYRRRLFVGTKNKTLGTSTTRRYRVLTYRVSVSSSGLAVAKHRRPPPEGERQFLFLFFSFLFFFCFRFCSLSFFCGCGGTTQSSSASSYWTAAGQWQLRETISSCGFVTFTAFFFFFPKKFHFDGSRAKPAFRFFLCLPSFLPSSSAENSVTSSRKSLIQPEAKVVFFVVGCRFLRFRVGAHTKKKRPAKVS